MQDKHIRKSAAPTPAQLYPVAPGQPRGTVLMYTFVILMLMTLMGSALMVNSRTELQITGSTVQGRDAFTKADATAQLGLLAARAIMQPTAGDVRDMLDNTKSGDIGQKEFEVEINSDLYTSNHFQSIKDLVTVDDIRERYLRVTEGDSSNEPHLILKYGGDQVGTAYIGLAVRVPAEAGTSPDGYNPLNYAVAGSGSLEDGHYGSDTGTNPPVFLVVSSQGRRPKDAGSTYYDEAQAGINSVITLIFREILP